MRFKDENYRKEKSNPHARLDCFSLLIKYTTLPLHQPWPAPRHSHLFPVALKHLEEDSPPKKVKCWMHPPTSNSHFLHRMHEELFQRGYNKRKNHFIGNFSSI